MEHDIYIDEDGTIEHIYDDAIADLFDGDGETTVTRASHVEPHPRGGWFADMRPVNGPLLGVNDSGYLPNVDALPTDIEYYIDEFVVPFTTRAEALAAERRWLSEHYFTKGDVR